MRVPADYVDVEQDSADEGVTESSEEEEEMEVAEGSEGSWQTESEEDLNDSLLL